MTAFFDTNVLVYANVADPRKRRAESLVAQGGLISAQILNEFTNVLRRKLRRDWNDVDAAVHDVLGAFPTILPLTAATHAGATAIARRHSLSFYDALIVASALEGGCDVLWTEDLQHGQAFGPLLVQNPFRA